MKKLVAAGLCSLVVGVVAPLPVAHAAGDRCSSKSEFRQVKIGMSKTKVKQIIGYAGRKFFDFDQYESREYQACSSKSGFVWISYEYGKVTEKHASWR